MLRGLVVVISVVVAVLGPASASVWGFRVSADHPRDPGAFVAEARRHLTAAENDVTDPDYVTGDALLAEGERACRWLGRQPIALWRGGERFQDAGLAARYRDEVASTATAGEGVPEATARVAWTYLCGLAWQVRRPHRLPNPFAHDG